MTLQTTAIKPLGSFAKDLPLSYLVQNAGILDKSLSDIFSRKSQGPKNLAELHKLVSDPEWIQVANADFGIPRASAEKIRASTLEFGYKLSASLK